MDSDEEILELEEDVLEEPKNDTESWVEWIRKVTRYTEEQLDKANITDWVTNQRKRLWTWAGHVARREESRWTTKALNWMPRQGRRRVGRPCQRWEDPLQNYFNRVAGDGTIWRAIAMDRETWKSFEDGFLQG